MSSSEVSQTMQEFRLDLVKAMDLMERERPGASEKLYPNPNVSFSFVSL